MEKLNILKQAHEENLVQLKEVSNIVIKFSTCMCEPGKHHGEDFMIHSVNDFKEPVEFYNHVYYLFANALLEAMTSCQEESKETRVLFLNHVKESFGCFKRVCRIDVRTDITAGTQGIVFNHPEYISSGPHNIPKYALDRVLYLTKEYAISWNSIVDEFIHKISYLRDLDEYTNWKPDPEKPNKKPPKLPLKMTVAQFAVFARACMDLDIFDVDSVAELTRILPAMISTLRTTDISPKSLRNHMESISIEDIDRTVFDLRKILQYLNVMKNRMEREDGVSRGT